MGIFDELNRLRKGKGSGTRSFLLKNGTRYYFDLQEAFSHIFLHASVCARAGYKRKARPKHLPEVLVKLSQAKDRERAIRMLYPTEILASTWEQGGPFCAIDLKHLVETGELIPRCFAPSYPPIEAA